MDLNAQQQSLLDGQAGEAAAMAMRILLNMATVEGAEKLVPITSAHVDGCLLHGASGVAFAELLQAGGGQVRVPASLNVGAMDLVRPENVLLKDPERDLAIRLMNAYVAMGCIPTWTCAPYQAGFRPGAGQDIAWAESNAVVFANSVLGAHTNRYGDFMDICCALTGYAPFSGLHVPQNRLATIVVDTRLIPGSVKHEEAFYAVLGSWLGRTVGSGVAVIDGLPADVSEDRLKALGASAASTGAVALFHAVGLTPAAQTLEVALGGREPELHIDLTLDMVLGERDRMSTVRGDRLDVVAVGSPHFSLDEFQHLLRALRGRTFSVPFYACTGRHVQRQLESHDLVTSLERAGVSLILDTCVVVTPVIAEAAGVLMTNSGKFSHYSRSLIGHEVVFGSLAECVESAVQGKVSRDPHSWGAA